MTQKITLLLKSENVTFAKRKAKNKGTSVSKMVDRYFDIVKRIDKKMESEKLDPFVKKFSGIVNTGKNEDKNSTF